MTGDPWPWPTDTQLERARRVARSYREALESLNPGVCENIDRKVTEFGQEWIKPELDMAPEAWELLSARDLEVMVGVPASSVRAWAAKGRLTKRTSADGSPVYLVEEVRELIAETRHRKR
ncbi:hypothetical protein P3H15_27315 [Rhodococcus sp. T2V]|uniref:hypothetical protein n=1 Tax=Rhodococcus sp. T2V TaxID=3034164 RepID=UPI0023E1EAC7|nr:hypothetical protein [Rhodococcus sp. T2V]MDF3308732.1 hypothetical protein [Rhodococcus sp. T2V]